MGKTFKRNDEYSRNKKNKFQNRQQKRFKKYEPEVIQCQVIPQSTKDQRKQNHYS